MLNLTKLLPKRVIFSIFALTLTKPYQKEFFSILTKALPKRMLLIYFCPYSSQNLTKKDVFLYFDPNNTKPCKKWCFLQFCLYLNQSPFKKGVFLYFCPNLNESLTTKGVVFSISNNSPTKKRVFSILALILTKALPNRVCSLFFPF